MKRSTYAQRVPGILAEMEKGREEDTKGNKRTQPDQTEEPPETVLFSYKTEGGGRIVSDIPLEDYVHLSNMVDSQPETTDQRPIPPQKKKEPPYLLHFLLILVIFVLLDIADTQFTTLLSPTVNITIIPLQQTITTSATFPIGTGQGTVQGRVLPSLTISQSQTVAATGRGHQDARRATGTLTFYNGSFSAQTIGAGTIYTGSGGVQVATDQTITIAAANPPYVGEATVSASAIHAGASGNIPPGDISITTATLQVRNSQFSGGQDARDFPYVQRSDIWQASSTLTPFVLQSVQGAFAAQLHQGETLRTPPCTPGVFSNHKSGEEAQNVTVTVTATCKGVAYDQTSLQNVAGQVLHAKLVHLGMQYQLIGQVQITIRAITLQNGSATIDATIHGVWAYMVNEGKIKALIAGKQRGQALKLLSRLPGVQKVSLSGVSGNDVLPSDVSHISVLILVQE